MLLRFLLSDQRDLVWKRATGNIFIHYRCVFR
nr:MAG TPA: hypothetical protein [Caudoviricetes sp.]DAY74531.1 MAG TPA: hypothetical protein [Caudoviricetes sp.]